MEVNDVSLKVEGLRGKKSILKKLFLYIILFLFIYSPPLSIFPVNVSLLMTVMCLGAILKINKNIALKVFRVEFFLLLFICIYSLSITVFSGTFNPVNVLFNGPIILLFFNVPMVFFIYSYMLRLYGGDERGMYENVISVLINVASFAAIISILLWINKDFNDYIKFDVLKYSRELLVYQSHRGFGFSDELLFSFSIVQACIVLLAVERFGVNLRTAILFILVFISISLNARTGYLFLPMVFFLPKFWKRGTLLYFIYSSFVISILIYYKTDGFLFIEKQFLYFIDDATGNSNVSSLDFLLNHMLFLPNAISEIIFGSGKNIFGAQMISSDSGYVLLVFYGGLFYLSLILFLVASCLLRGLKVGRFLPVAIISFVFIVSNIKGLFFAPKPGMHLLMIVYIFLIMSARNNLTLKLKGTN